MSVAGCILRHISLDGSGEIGGACPAAAADRCSDLMAPMAVPTFGRMLIELMTMFVVPVLYSLKEELLSGTGASGLAG